ncbi:MAG: U32 family peptidase [Eubacteriales bacterium]|nr:U32 family peptidase [Eubacteriales bacterium]
MIKTELLAPAGDMSCLRAALSAGADAVYLGGQRFGARAFAGNFSDEELAEAIKLAHFFDKKVYLTVNTLTKDVELEQLIPWLTPFYEAGLDGLIIQDLGVLERCRKAFPGLLLHASTQMTVTEATAARFLKELGVSRVVPARELSLEEIITIKQETGMELETFIHGALCYSYSGQCLFSSLLGGRSGNRGRCAQPCRLPYTIAESGERTEKKKNGRAQQYPLSLKDLCTLPLLPRLLEAGIDSLKIEGRMKSPEYVAGVTAIYRKYIDLYEKDPDGWQVEKKDLDFLSHLYVRSELSGGYYEKHNGKEMVTLTKPGYAGAAETVLEEIRQKYLQNGLTRKVNLTIWLKEGEPAKLRAVCGGNTAEREGMAVMPALKKPLSREDVEKQLRKTGGSCFAPDQIAINMEGAVFLPVSALNELRRQTLDLLADQMTEGYRRIYSPRLQTPEPEKKAEKTTEKAAEKTAEIAAEITAEVPGLYVSALYTKQALEAVKSPEVERVYLSADAVLEPADREELLNAVRMRKAEKPDFSFWLMLPAILRSYSRPYFERLMEWIGKEDHETLADGLMAGSLSGLLWAKSAGWTKGLSLQHSAYVFNRETLDFFMRHFSLDSYTMPLELNRKEGQALPGENMEMTVYGRIPMMVSANCVRKTSGECRISHTQKSLSEGLPVRGFRFFLKDRYQAEFPVLINCRHCMNTIYNSVPLSLHQYLGEIRKCSVRAVRLDFTDESAADAGKIIRFFAGEEGQGPTSYTTGHYKKGVQ